MRSGSPRRRTAHDFPRREIVYRQTQRCLAADCFQVIIVDLGLLARLAVVPQRAVRARKARFRRLVRDDERLQKTVEGLHLVAFSCLMLHQAVDFLAELDEPSGRYPLRFNRH